MLGDVALTDHFERRALVMVSCQIVIAIGVIVYGLVPQSLGLRMVGVALVLLAWIAVVGWLTLTRPWAGGFETGAVLGAHADRQWFQRRWGLNETGLVLVAPAIIAQSFIRLIAAVKSDLRAWASAPPDAPKWAFNVSRQGAHEADPFGFALVLESQGLLALAVPALAVFVLWVLLPR